MLHKMVENMLEHIKEFSKYGFDIPEDEMKILKKWYHEGAIEFKKSKVQRQRDLYAPCLMDPLWKDVYVMTWLKVFRLLCEKCNVKVGLGKASLLEYKASGWKYKFYPVISVVLEDYDKQLEEDLLEIASEIV